MSGIVRVIASLVLVLMVAMPAPAGIADSPLPILQAGKKTVHLYSVIGVISQPNTGTFFTCTSTASSAVRVGVEIFLQNGQPFTFDQREVPAGGSVTFGTLPGGGGNVFAVDQVVGNGGGVSLGTPAPARILATSKSLICTAFVFNSGTLTMNHLTIIAKTKQKAAN